MAQTELARSWTRTVRGFEPVLSLWRPLASLRFAIALIGFISAAGLLSVLLPQIPVVMQGNQAAIDAWIEFQKGRFGLLTEPMYRVGLFSVFDAPWFIGALGLLASNGELIAQPIPLTGIPASDSLSAEDIWQNPTFVGGVVNGGPTAHSEW